MVANRDWLPRSLPDQLVMFQNVIKKIADYTSELPLTAAQETRIALICDIFISVYNYVSQARATTESLVEWRDFIFNGSPAGDAAPAAPTFAAYSRVTGAFIGIFQEFRDLVDLIKASPGYTRAIGEDLMIVATKAEDAVTPDPTPDLKVTTSQPYTVEVAGSMQGMDAIRVEYQRKGASGWSIAAFLTKLPGEFTITPATPGEPETGHIRAVFTKKNADFGNFSPDYPVTVS